MKTLIARLNAQLFRIYSQDGRISSVGRQEESSDDEDIFARAFQEQVILGNGVYFIYILCV